MSAVIYVDDSSDEEDVAIAVASARPRSSVVGNIRAKMPGSMSNTTNDVVELLDDSDDEDAISTSARRQKYVYKATTSSKQSQPTTDEDEWLKKQMEMAKKASIASLQSDVTRSKQKAKRVSLSQSPKLDDSDSDLDDDSIFNFTFSAKKKPQARGDQHSTTILSQSSESSTASRPIVNPYAKKTPAKKTSTITAASSSAPPTGPAVNPCASSQKKASTATPSSGPRTIVKPFSGKKRASSSESITPSTIPTESLIYGSFENFPIGHLPYPMLLNRSKKHDDLRARFLLAFWKNARSLTLNSFQRPKLDQTCNKIVSLALWPYPLRSLDEFCIRPKTSGSSLAQDETQHKALKEQLEEGGFERITVPVAASEGGKYCSISEACLVAMATEVERRGRLLAPEQSLKEHLTSKGMWISLEFLIPEIDKRLQHFCPGKMLRVKDWDGGVTYYTDPNTRSAEYKQIEKLKLTCTIHNKDVSKEANNGHEGYIKQHKYQKQVVFELTPLGYQSAKWIQQRVFPAPPGHYRTSHIAGLDQVKPEHQDICLGMDFREGGLKRSVIQRMCNKLDWKRMPYFVGSLDIGDYAFFWTRPGPDQGKLCPIIVERKSIQDVAQSIKDGRWKTQKHRMYHGQYVFGYNNCRIAYLIEGKEEKQLVSGGYVGHRKFGVTHEQLLEAIKGLEAEGFDVLRSTTPENSMFELAKWATKVAEEVRTGKLKVQYTYAEFKAEVSKIPKQVDFSRMAKDAMETRKEKEEQAAAKKSAQMEQEKEESGTDSKEKAKTAKQSSTSMRNVGSNKPNACVSIDLCSDDDDDDDDPTDSTPQAHRKTVRSAAGNSNGRAKQKSGNLKDASLSHAGGQSSQPTGRFKPSAAVQAYFDVEDTDNDSDEDSDVAEALRTIRKQRKRDEQRKKRKREEEAERNTNRRKTAPKAGGKSKSTEKHRKKATSEKGAPSVAKAKQSTSPSTEESKEKQPTGEYEEWTSTQLQAKCVEYGMPKNGTKAEMIERLRGPKPPKIWLERKTSGEYVPARHNTGATALLVALHLHERQIGLDAPGMTKEDLYARAEELEISKNPFSGGTTQTGPYHYDGWSSMSSLLKGDPALVIMKKHSLYKLTRSGRFAGVPFAKAMHRWCHKHNACNCGGVLE